MTIILIFSLIGLVLWFFVPIVVQQAVILSKLIFTAYPAALRQPIDKINQRLRSLGLEPGPGAADQVKSLLGNYFDPAKLSGFSEAFSARQATSSSVYFRLFLSPSFSSKSAIF
ncbi:MAG: hypothetical protein U0T81_17430 [Saprospiraceae bacterium]